MDVIAEALVHSKLISGIHMASSHGEHTTVDIKTVPSRRSDGSPQLSVKFSRTPPMAVSNHLTIDMYPRKPNRTTWGMQANVRAEDGVKRVLSILGGYTWSTYLSFSDSAKECDIEWLLKALKA